MNRLLIASLFLWSGHVSSQRVDFKDIDFSAADSVATLYPKYPLQDLYGLSQKLTSSLPTDVEKFRAIYRWVSTNIENDYALYLEDNRMRTKLQSDNQALNAWTRKFNVRMFRRLMDRYQTVCLGYAYLVKELALHAALSCQVVGGYGRTARSNIGGNGIPNHAWNAINLNGKWYLCDATWSSGAIDEHEGRFIRHYNDEYFLTDPVLFARNHFPLDTAWLLLKHKPALGQFLNGPLIYKSAITYSVNNITPTTFNLSALKGQEVLWCFDVSDSANIINLSLEIDHSGKMSKPLTADGTKHICISHVFTKKGTFAVHLLINSEYVYSYSVDVL